MKLEKELQNYREQNRVEAREEKIRETIEQSKKTFLLGEQEKPIHYFEFLLGQFRVIRKRWWILQTLTLGLVSVGLSNLQDREAMLRVLGVIGVLFVVLVIPEFWRNKSCDCMQVEATCLYSLRQIYAARMVLFGLIDTLILTWFFVTISGRIGFTVTELLVQFVFPMLVAACICFGTLCSRTIWNEGVAIFFCLLWSAVWYVILLNEVVYAAIAFPIWCALFGAALVFLACVVYRTIHDCNRCWETTAWKQAAKY